MSDSLQQSGKQITDVPRGYMNVTIIDPESPRARPRHPRSPARLTARRTGGIRRRPEPASSRGVRAGGVRSRRAKGELAWQYVLDERDVHHLGSALAFPGQIVGGLCHFLDSREDAAVGGENVAQRTFRRDAFVPDPEDLRARARV